MTANTVTETPTDGTSIKSETLSTHASERKEGELLPKVQGAVEV